MFPSGTSVEMGEILAEMGDPDRARQRESQISLLELQLRQARLELEELEKRQQEARDNSIIRAPVDGILVLPEMTRREGEEAPPGTLLAYVVDYSHMKAAIPVDELDINKVQVGQEVRVRADALPGKEISGRVTQIASQGRSLGGVATFDVTIEIEAPEGLRAGMTAHASILVDHRINTLLVPIEGIFEQNGQTVVMVPQEGREDMFTPVPVLTGAYDNSWMEILEGLEEDQKIFIQGSGGFDFFGGFPGGRQP